MNDVSFMETEITYVFTIQKQPASADVRAKRAKYPPPPQGAKNGRVFTYSSKVFQGFSINENITSKKNQNGKKMKKNHSSKTPTFSTRKRSSKTRQKTSLCIIIQTTFSFF